MGFHKRQCLCLVTIGGDDNEYDDDIDDDYDDVNDDDDDGDDNEGG